MSRNLVFGVVLITLSLVVLGFSSCKQSGSSAPVVHFQNAVGYVYEDTSIVHGATFTIWVYATKMGVNDLLESGTITRSINGGPDSTLQNISFVSTQFNQFYSYTAGSAGNTERYTFTFANQNQVSSSVSVKVTDI